MSSEELWRAILNTAIVCLGSMAIAVPIGSLIAILLVRTNIVGRKWIWIGISSQLAVPLYGIAGSWNAGFGSQGWWPLSQVVAVRFELAGFLAVVFIHGLASIPWVVLITSCGLQGSQRSLEESAIVEGGTGYVLRHVTWPTLWPWLALSCFWACAPVLTEMVVTNLYQVPTLAEQIYLDTSRGVVSPLTYPTGVFLCMLPVIVLAVIVNRHLPPLIEVVAKARQHPARLLPIARWQAPLSLLCWFFLTVLILLPMLNLVVKAGWSPFNDANSITRYGWSISRFARTLVESTTLYGPEFYWSSTLAVVSASCALLLASVLFSCTGRTWSRWLVHLGMLAMVGTPGAIVGMSMIWLLNRSQPALLGMLYDHTLIACILAQQFRLLPLAWLLVQGVTATLDHRSWELARIEGLNRWQILRRVVWPQTGLRWALAWALLMIVSFGELSTTILVLPPGVTTLSMRLFEMLHFGMRHQDSGLCLILVVVGWISSFAIWKTLNDRNISGC